MGNAATVDAPPRTRIKVTLSLAPDPDHEGALLRALIGTFQMARELDPQASLRVERDEAMP